jgi:hypothetical protein
MLGRVLAAAAAAFAISLMLSGCVTNGTWQFPALMRPHQTAYTSPRYIPPQSRPPASQSYSVNKGSARDDHPNTNASGPTSTHATPPASPPAEASPQPTVTLAGDSASRDRALRLLDDAGARLARVNRNKLDRDSAATYDQANDFLNAGRKAALDQDYVAATGDAKKASVLADKLNASSH